MSVARPLVFCLALLAAPSAARAQEPQDTFALSELVVTATRFPLPRSAVPAAVTVLDGDALRARGVRFLADALREVPGAAVARSGSTGGLTSLFLRGGEGDYVQVLVDGVALNEPGGAIDLGQLTTDNVDRIEIVRGPASVLYGSDAVTGVIHVFTRRGAGRTRLEVGADVGTTARRNGRADVCPGYPRTPCPAGADLGSATTRSAEVSLIGAAGALDWSASASTLASDGAYAFNNRYDNRSVSGRVGVQTATGDGAVSLRWTDGAFHYPTDGAGRLDDGNVYRSSASLALGIEGGRALSDRLELRGALSWHEGDFSTVDDPDSAADTLGFYASLSAARVDRRKADAHANLHLGPAVATVGVELERQEGASDFTSRSQFGPFESSSSNERTNRAGYAQVVAGPAGVVTATAGARLESNERFGEFVTWRGGVNARVRPTTVVRASAGTAFKEPTFFENYAEGFTTGNPELGPERSRSWEIGVDQTLLDGRGALGATWFDQRFRNLIQYTGSPAPGTSNYVNVGAATSRGLEVGARTGRADGASLAASWTHLLTEVVDAGFGTDALFQGGQRLVRRPGDRVTLSGAAPAGSRLRGGAALDWVGEREDLDFLDDFNGERITLPAYGVVRVFGDVRVFDRGERSVTVRVRIENLLDEDYREIANFPAPGRTLSVALRAGAGL